MGSESRNALRLITLAMLVGTIASTGYSQPTREMIKVPAGEFRMGNDHGPADEAPLHGVFVAAFQIDRLPVTNARFAQFLNDIRWSPGAGPRLYDHDDPDARIHRSADRWLADHGYQNHPVVEVPWAGALAYCAHSGRRLPTEAEWEKAARGTDGRRYPWGNDAPDAARAHYRAGLNATAEVGSHPAGASPYGILDLSGNVWEWVSSAYRGYPYSPTDGRENLAPGPVRGTRGGGHDSGPADLTTTQRGRNLSRNPGAGHHNIGFRCAVSDGSRE